MTEWKWVIDVSSYQSLTREQWRRLVEAGLSGVVIKASQGDTIKDSMLERHLEAIAPFGLGFHFYHWTDPTRDAKRQADLFLSLVDRFRPLGAWADEEQYWSDWVAYWNYFKTKSGYVPRFGAQTLLSAYYNFSNYLKIGLLGIDRTINRGIYSARWFVDGYCKQMAGLINSEPFYWNMYPRNFVDLDGDKRVDMNEIEPWLATLTPRRSDLPTGVNKFDLWQVGDLSFEGICNLDVNVLTPSVWEVLFNKQPAIPEEKPVVPLGKFRVLTEVLNMRSSPNVAANNDIGDLHQGDLVDALDFVGTDAWIRLEGDRYCCVQKGKQIYLEPIRPEEG